MQSLRLRRGKKLYGPFTPSKIKRMISVGKIKTTDLIGKGKDQITMDLLPVEVVGEYAAEDADYTYRLCRIFEPMLDEKNLRDVFTRIEMPLVPILSKVERNGVRLDRARLKSLETELSDRIEAVELIVSEIETLSRGMPSRSTSMSSRLAIETPTFPTSPRECRPAHA